MSDVIGLQLITNNEHLRFAVLQGPASVCSYLKDLIDNILSPALCMESS